MKKEESVIEDIRQAHESKYGVAVFDLVLRDKNKTLYIDGFVLSKNQEDQILSEIKNNSDKEIISNIKILSDLDSGEIGWAVVNEKTYIKNRFVRKDILNDKILERIKSYEVEKGAVVRMLFNFQNQFIVQCEDLSFGWIDEEYLDISESDFSSRWLSGREAKNNEEISSDKSADLVVIQAKKYLSVPYGFGKKFEDKMDCSALTQFSYKKSLNIILPRHSWDQKEKGVQVNIEEAKNGDLVFMLNRKKGTKHVGIFERSGEEKYIIHACLAEKKVVRQSLEEVFKNYEMVCVKRIIK